MASWPPSPLSPGLVTGDQHLVDDVGRLVTDDATPGSPPRATATAYARPHTGQPSAVSEGPAGVALVTAYTYEAPGPGGFARRLSRPPPAGFDPAPLTPAEARTNPCPAGGSANQGGLARTTTAPDPDGAGPTPARVEEVVHDGAGRPVASRVGTEPWSCATYDGRGRPLTRTVAAFRRRPGPHGEL